MNPSFNAPEILAMAVRIEENGERFYRAAAAGAVAPLAKTLLEDLAAMETEHARRFREMAEAWSAPGAVARAFDPDDDALKILASWADGSVFLPPGDADPGLSGTEGMETILRTAVVMEKDSVVFYLGLKEAAPTDADRATIEAVIAEELRHVALLGAAIKGLAAPN